MMPSICSKAAANISLASDIILSHLDGSEMRENQHQSQQEAANTGLSALLPGQLQSGVFFLVQS